MFKLFVFEWRNSFFFFSLIGFFFSCFWQLTIGIKQNTVHFSPLGICFFWIISFLPSTLCFPADPFVDHCWVSLSLFPWFWHYLSKMLYTSPCRQASAQKSFSLSQMAELLFVLAPLVPLTLFPCFLCRVEKAEAWAGQMSVRLIGRGLL